MSRKITAVLVMIVIFASMGLTFMALSAAILGNAMQPKPMRSRQELEAEYGGAP